MPAILDEQTQFVDSSGKPLVNGKVYFGVQNADPVLNPVSIFSDRELTVALTNPQLLDSLGRTANKVWLAGRYSMRVDDLSDVQVYQELDNGESADVGVTAVENVVGANTITATATSTITSYGDLELYAFRTAQANTTGVTLNIDGVGAKSVLKNHDQAILPGEFEANQNIVVSRNETDDVFEWINQNNKVIDFYEGTAVATATAPNIWVADGNTVHLTGTVTVVTFADAPNVGAWRESVADGAFTLTHGSGITLEGGANISIVAGDRISVYADAVDAFRAWVTKADGRAVVASSAPIFTESFESSEQTITAAGSLTLPHSLTVQPPLYLAFIKCITAEFGYSIGDELSVTINMDSGAANRGVSVVPDGTNLNIRFGSTVSVFVMLNKSTGAAASTTDVNWKLILRAYA